MFSFQPIRDKQEMVMHSDDTIAPVGYLNFLEAHLEDKEVSFGIILSTLPSSQI